MESGFLEKYFRYNLSDYFGGMLQNVYEDVFDKKVYHKPAKMLSSQLFICQRHLLVEEFEKNIEQFYKSNSKTIESNELPYAFKLVFCNYYPVPNSIAPNELIFMDVKIKAEVGKI